MAERDTQLDREVDTDVDIDDVDLPDDDFGVEIPDDALDKSETRETGGGLRERASKRIGLSKRGLAVSAVTALVGVLVLGSVFPFGLVGNLLGLFVAAFLYGTIASKSQYLSIGLASGTAGGVVSVLGNLTLTLLGPGIPIAAVGAIGGFLAGVLGHYFGRDLRDGLTREI
jgi:hypothetical protein